MLEGTSLLPDALARWPAVRDALHAAPPIAVERVAHGATETLIVEGKQLTSRRDRRREAALQAGRIPTDATDAWVYGPALGDSAEALLGRPGLRRLTVVLLNRALTREVLLRAPWPWLADPRLTLMLGADARQVFRPFVASPACLAVAEPAAARLRDLVQMELEAPFQALKERERDALFARRIEESASIVEGDADVAQLFGTRAGATVLVAAGGPTLDDRLDWIRARRGELVIVAVNRSLRALLAAGIRPDYCAVADPNDAIVPHFGGLPQETLAEVGLVYVPSVPREVLATWPGPRYAAYLDHPRFAEARRARPRALLFCPGTVTHLATDLAVKLGAARVLFAGADFGYVRGEGHARGARDGTSAASRRPGATWVVTGRGQRIASEPKLAAYRLDLEAYVAAHGELDWVNLSREGAALEGCRYLEELP